MQIILSLGSNHDAEVNIAMAEKRLSSLFPAIRFSRTMMNAPYGNSDLAMFGNAIGVGETTLPLPALRKMMKALEQNLGRTAQRKMSGRIDMDIDILQYGNLRMKHDDWLRSYNVTLLEELNNCL